MALVGAQRMYAIMAVMAQRLRAGGGPVGAASLPRPAGMEARALLSIVLANAIFFSKGKSLSSVANK